MTGGGGTSHVLTCEFPWLCDTMSAERNAVQWNVPIHTMECSDPYSGMFRSIQWNVPIHTMECADTPHRKGDLCQQHGNGHSLPNPHWGKHLLSHLYFHFRKRHSQKVVTVLFYNYVHNWYSFSFRSIHKDTCFSPLSWPVFTLFAHICWFSDSKFLSTPVEQHPPFAVMQRIFNASWP